MESSTPPESRLTEIKEQQQQQHQPPPLSSSSAAGVAAATSTGASSAAVKSKPSPLSALTGNTAAAQLAAQHSSGNILHTPTTPRIDISRASSSSHHDSRDSSPENVFDQVIVLMPRLYVILFPRY